MKLDKNAKLAVAENKLEVKREPCKTLNCDQVAWVLDVLERYKKAILLPFPSISRIKEVAKYSAVLELMEILNMDLDDDAKQNLMPEEFR